MAAVTCYICYQREGSYSAKTGSEPPVAVYQVEADAQTYCAAHTDPARHGGGTVTYVTLVAP